jgi:hypothetical protein
VKLPCLFHAVIATFQTSAVSAKVLSAFCGRELLRLRWLLTRSRSNVFIIRLRGIQPSLSDRPLVAFCSITVYLLIRLAAFWIYEKLRYDRLLSRDLVGQASGRADSLVRTGGPIPFIERVVGVVVGHPLPVVQIAIPGQGREIKSVSQCAPSTPTPTVAVVSAGMAPSSRLIAGAAKATALEPTAPAETAAVGTITVASGAAVGTSTTVTSAAASMCARNVGNAQIESGKASGDEKQQWPATHKDTSIPESLSFVAMQRGRASVQHWISAASRSSGTHNLRDTAAAGGLDQESRVRHNASPLLL